MWKGAYRERQDRRDDLAALSDKYVRNELPPIVWKVAESDIDAPIVYDDDPLSGPYLNVATGDAFGLSQDVLDEIRETIGKISVCLPDDQDRLENLQASLWEICEGSDGLGDDPTASGPGAPNSDANRPGGRKPPVHNRKARTAGDSTESDWEWDPECPLDSAQVWTRSLLRCEHVNATPKLLGLAMREVADTRDGTVYFGSVKALVMLGMKGHRLKEHRPKLVRAGWLTDTGRRTGYGLTVYRLTVPRCCEGRGLENPDLIIDHD